MYIYISFLLCRQALYCKKMPRRIALAYQQIPFDIQILKVVFKREKERREGRRVRDRGCLFVLGMTKTGTPNHFYGDKRVDTKT